MKNKSENEGNNNSSYSNDPFILDKFQKNYLTNLNVFLDDNKFNQKITQLPELKSATTTKIEKIIEKKSNARQVAKSLVKVEPQTTTSRDKLNSNVKKNEKYEKKRKPESSSGHLKPIVLRFIILDPENRHTDSNNIDDSFQQYTTKLMNPYRTLLAEENVKIKKQAIEQIVSNALSRDKKNKTNNNSQHSIVLGTPVETSLLMGKYNKDKLSSINYDNMKTKENFDHFMRFFKENCEQNNLITVDQKIDYFVLLKGSSLMTMKKETERNPPSLLRKDATINNSINKKHVYNTNLGLSYNNAFSQTSSTNQENRTPTNRETFASVKSKSLNIDIFYKFVSELKAKFKITEEAVLIKSWETFYNDLMAKIGSLKNVNSLENSVNTIERIKYYLNCKEILSEKVILRECEMTHDRLYYLIAKKTFDFRIIQHLNLSKNQLGDIGGCYLLYLIDSYSNKLDYLNISYNKLGKQSVEFLTSILQKNTLKLLSLNIGGNQIGDKLFSEICVGISKNSHLSKLYTNDNELGKISSTILGTILRYDKKLKVLDVSKNLFDDNCIGFLLKGLISNVTLEILYVNENNLSNNALRNFETTLTINTSIKEIFMEKNNFNNKACEMISEILNRNKFVEYISLAGNKFKNEAVEKILDLQKKVKAKIVTKTDYYQSKLNGQEKINFFEFL